jgi:hypothetical protein
LPWSGFELTTLMVIGSDCMGSYKSNYHRITITTTPVIKWGSSRIKILCLTFKEIKHLSDYRTVGLSDRRTVGLSDCRIIGRTPFIQYFVKAMTSETETVVHRIQLLDISIGFWNCSESVVIFCFWLIPLFIFKTHTQWYEKYRVYFFLGVRVRVIIFNAPFNNISVSGTDTSITMAVLNRLSYNQRNRCSNIWYAIYIRYVHTDNSGLLINVPDHYY